MKLICPRCGNLITGRDVNVAADLARCARCDEVFKASELVAEVDVSELHRPPAGAMITFRPDHSDGGTFAIPRSGVSIKDAYPIFFGTVWITFLAFMTFGIAKNQGFVALFLIPFWVIGVAMWRAILTGITEAQQVEVGAEALTVVKKSVVSSQRHRVRFAAIGSIAVETTLPRNPFEMMRYTRYSRRSFGGLTAIPLPTIAHGTKKLFFAENVSEMEMQWLVKILKAMVYKKVGKKV